jgi:hypothetical protein
MNASAFYKRQSYSYLLVPGNYARPEILQEWDARLKENRLLMVSDIFQGNPYAHIRSYADLKAQLDSNAYATLRRDTIDRAHIVACYNDVLVRKPYDEFEKKGAGIYVPASVFVLGRMFYVDNDDGIAEVPAGAEKGTVFGGAALRVELNDPSVDELTKRYHVIPIVAPFGQGGPLQIYGVRSLCSAKPYDQFSVVKVYDYVARVLNDIAEQKRFRRSDQRTRYEFEELVRTFLDKAKGNIFENYEGLDVRFDPEDPARLLCQCKIKYFRQVETFDFSVGYRLRDVEGV